MCPQIHEFMSACFCIVRAHSGPHSAASAMCVKGGVCVYFGWFSPPLTIVLRTTLYECYRTGTLASVQQTVNVSIFHHSAALEPCWRGKKTEKTNTRNSDLGTFIHFTHKFKTRLANCIMCCVFFAKLFTKFYPYLSFLNAPLRLQTEILSRSSYVIRCCWCRQWQQLDQTFPKCLLSDGWFILV